MRILGVDIGTTAVKAMLADDDGNIEGRACRRYELIKSGSGRVEQRADDWWDTFAAAVRDCTEGIEDKSSIAALSLSTQGASLVPVDRNGVPLSNAVIWMDRRAVAQQEDLLKIHPDGYYYCKTGWKLWGGGNLIQIVWMRHNDRNLFDRSVKFLSTLDYINFKLTGRYVIDHTNAGMTQLADIKRGDWDGSLLDAAGITADRLACMEETGRTVGNLRLDAADALGLSTDVKIINGGHDQYCAALGAGATDAGDLLLSCGTAWVVLGIYDTPVFDHETHMALGRHVIKGLWGTIASIPAGGASMEWFRDRFAAGIHTGARNGHDNTVESFDDIDAKASGRMQKAAGLMFYPYFSGSGYPDYNIGAKAALVGLGLEHDRYDIALAIMEGVAFEAGNAIERFRKKGCPAEKVKMLGGASQSGLWADLVASVTGLPVVRMKEADSACIGALILAGTGCGIFRDHREGCRKLVKGEVQVGVNDEKRDFYSLKLDRYNKVMEIMKAI